MARLMAALVLLLAISATPVPFATFHPAEVGSEQVLHSGAAQIQAILETTMPATPGGGTPGLVDHLSFETWQTLDRTGSRGVKVLVLRI